MPFSKVMAPGSEPRNWSYRIAHDAVGFNPDLPDAVILDCTHLGTMPDEPVPADVVGQVIETDDVGLLRVENE